MIPNLDWYLSISTQQQLSPRCPYATVYHCPRYYQSLSLLGEAGSTGIAPAEDSRLKQQWEQTEVWPVTAEQATSISGPGNEVKHFMRFCPEVSYDRFGLFAAELHRFADEIDVDCTHKTLRNEGATPEDWRWNWSLVESMHYTQCPLYSLLRVGKGKDGPKPIFPDIGMPDSITSHLVSITECDDYTAQDVENLIVEMYEHPEIKTYEIYCRQENPHLQRALDDYRITGDTVKMHYYKDPDYELSFVKINKNAATSDWEKHLIATSPMYFKREITLSDRQRERMDRERSQTVWDRAQRHPVYVILMILAAIASLIGLVALFRGTEDNNKINSQTAPQLHEVAKTPVMRNLSSSSVASPPPVQEHTTSKNVRFEESLARMKVKLRSGMSYEQLVELLDEARVAKTMSGDIAPVQIRQFSCYEELENLWSQRTPNALLQRGVVSSWEEAKREYSFTEEPIINKKFAECYSY
ncbi:hypothetical protein GeomeDRAFT_1516 [Geobacter metallireducens RCH3]|nr:hypothetical protein [Geobacter metallireducens]EHP87177.1 hypothetical protein GeomeDRAFT_1516 [Geobacter metallireducens RCH3]